MVDFTKPECCDWFSDYLDETRSKYGIDGFKFDAGEVKIQNRIYLGPELHVVFTHTVCRILYAVFNFTLNRRTKFLNLRQSELSFEPI